jgi:DNA-binding NarL/FixJ family response regulator
MEKFYSPILHNTCETLKVLRATLEEYSNRDEPLPVSVIREQMMLIDSIIHVEKLGKHREVEYELRDKYAFWLKSDFPTLTNEEIQMCLFMLDESSNKKIADKMTVGYKSMVKYITVIRRKLSINSKQRGELRKFLRSFFAEKTNKGLNAMP